MSLDIRFLFGNIGILLIRGMALDRRIFVQDGVYHVYNRGNRKARIFHYPEDNAQFLIRLHEYAKRRGVDVLAYCLMGNHFHLLLRGGKQNAISGLMQSLGIAYAKYFNWRYELVGHVFQGRFGSRFIRDDLDLANVARYIHRNPAMSADINTYRWSDFRHHCERRTQLVDTLGWTPIQYKNYVYDEYEKMQATLKDSITGRPSS